MGQTMTATTAWPTPTVESVAAIIAETMGQTRRRVEAASMTADTTLDEIGADELDLIAIEMELHDRFGVSLSEDDMAEAATVGELVALVERGQGEG